LFSYTVFTGIEAVVATLEATSFSISPITFPLYVLRRISYLLGLVIKPTSMPVMESGSLISNLRIGIGDLYSKA